MRDVERIAPFLAEFVKLWKKEPYMRFGQLVIALQSRIDPNRDPFYTEDDEMLGAIRKMSAEYDRHAADREKNGGRTVPI